MTTIITSRVGGSALALPLQYGAVGDGIADDTAAINQAIAAVSEAGGGVVSLGVGTYLVSLTEGTGAAINMESNVTLRGAGKTATTITLADNQVAQVVAAANKSDFVIEGLGIDGNKDNQPAYTHGIRLAGCSQATIRDVLVQNCAGYGIGCQDGTLENILLDDVHVHYTNRDCIDFKNQNDDNRNIVLQNILTSNWGMDSELSNQVGVDIRGPGKLVNIQCNSPQNSGFGIRFREGLLGEGLGGNKSVLTNFHVDLTGTTGRGVQIDGSEVSVSNGAIFGGHRGVVIQGARFKVSNVTVDGCSDDAFLVDDADADYGVFSNCTALNVGDTAYTVKSNGVNIIGCWAEVCDEGFQVQATANDTVIIGGGVLSATTNELADGGTDTIVRHVYGIADST